MLLGLYPFLIIGIVWGCAYVIGVSLYGFGDVQENVISISSENGYPSRAVQTTTYNAVEYAKDKIYAYWPIILTVIMIWFVIAYFFHTKMVRKLSHSHPVTRTEEPELYNLLENLSIIVGMPTPKLEIIETHARNAFASGIDQKSFTVTVTRGLMKSLTKDELEAVLAHELTHILNRDVRLLVVAVIFTGMVGYFAQSFWSNIRYGIIGSRGESSFRSRATAHIILGLAAVLWLGYLATLFTRFAISRKREFMADAGAIKLTKKPEAMMTALMRIAGRDKIPESTNDIAMMCIENAKPFLGMFATHPPIEKRVQAISQITNTPVPFLSLPPASQQERFQNDDRKNPWLIRQRGSRNQ